MRMALRDDGVDRAARMQAFWVVPPPDPTARVIDLAAYRAAR